MFDSKICSYRDCRSYVSAPYDTCFHHSSIEERTIILDSLRRTLERKGLVKDVSIIGGDF